MRFIYFMLIALLALILLSFKAHASPTIAYFYDGDTVKIKEATKTYTLRINHIDAPERNQDYGKKSRRALIKLCQHASITVMITGIDKYHRQLGNISCNQQDVSVYMLKNGFAWFSKRYSKAPEMAAMEASARKNKRGLWKTDKPMAPWVWRHLINQH